MFDWLPELFYKATKTILMLIDFIISAVNKISGIDTITANGEQTDFLSYLFLNRDITYAFGVASLLGMILLVFFTIFAIVSSYWKDKQEETPAQIVKKAAKNILILLLIPTFMYLFIILTNAFVKAMYQATSCNSNSLAQFMFAIFARPALIEGQTTQVFVGSQPLCTWDMDLTQMWYYIDLWKFDFLYSYIMGGIVLYELFRTSIMFVERVISLIMLYFSAPFVVSASVLDDGGKFKTWRDQVTLKFLTAHGAILALNVFLLVVSVILNGEIQFFDEPNLDSFVKLVFVIGGAVSINQVQAIVGNLIQAGAGDKAIADNAKSAQSFGNALGSIAKSPFKGFRNLANFSRDADEYGLASAIGSRMGFKTSKEYGARSETAKNEALRERYGDSRVNRARDNYYAQNQHFPRANEINDLILGEFRQEGRNAPPPPDLNAGRDIVDNAIANDGNNNANDNNNNNAA